MERVLGLNHRVTLATRRQLARFTGEAGDPAGARDMIAALLPDWERVCGPDHASNVAIREALDHWARQAERGAP